MNASQLSEQLLLAVKKRQPAGPMVDQLADLPFNSFLVALDSDGKKKAFWINIYNAFFQILRMEGGLKRPGIYRKKTIRIAGYAFSLDDVEHGILRKYRLKWALGYLPDLFALAHLKKLAVRKIDFRIHFALNCGAKSCPPIAFYTPDKIERQLDLAALSFLEGDTEIFEEKKEVHITRLFQWFMGDFGGPGGIRQILKEKLNLETAGMKLVYKTYDWTENLENFT